MDFTAWLWGWNVRVNGILLLFSFWDVCSADTSFYAKVEKDLTSTNQQIVKSTINDLIVKQELPATASNLIMTTPRTKIYFSNRHS